MPDLTHGQHRQRSRQVAYGVQEGRYDENGQLHWTPPPCRKTITIHERYCDRCGWVEQERRAQYCLTCKRPWKPKKPRH